VLSFRRQYPNISSGNNFGPCVSVLWLQKRQNNLDLIATGSGIEQFERHLTPQSTSADALRHALLSIVRLKRDGTRAETRFRLSSKWTSSLKSVGASVQSTAGSRGVRISVTNAWHTTFRGSVRVLATHSTRQFPLHFPSRASPCAIRFQTHSTT
jgi:ribosomal protein L31